ncbi:SGNH/GDSL hydrolase family protein [Lapidilactobacillus wuchangensis]|uniref:hypothetical protein n=1 Tax=Lapidilactobacillus wuchangensis TaxID=2486001 RepID=UPI000F77687D|nr:hypothetical protein [Lapidilactobacillus wuchangensis]
MATEIVWKQIFSNYQQHHFDIPEEQITSYYHNVSGNGLQVELNNRFDDEPLIVSGVWASHQADFAEATPLTWNRQAQFQVPAEQSIWTDASEFALQAGETFYLKLRATNRRQRINALGSTSAPALMRLLAPAAGFNEQAYYYGIDAIRSQVETPMKTITFFGDSLISQCYLSAALAQLFYKKWPERVTAINTGIFGNRFLRSGNITSQWEKRLGPAGVKRFITDVLYDQPQLVISLVGLSDLVEAGAGSASSELPTSDQIIAGLHRIKQICDRRQIKFIPLTIPPFANSKNFEVATWSPKKEAIRLATNQFIMSLPFAVDLAKFVAQTDQPEQLDPKFDSGDHLHFSSTGANLAGQFIFHELTEAEVI